jgi:hypothetical protein
MYILQVSRVCLEISVLNSNYHHQGVVRPATRTSPWIAPALQDLNPQCMVHLLPWCTLASEKIWKEHLAQIRRPYHPKPLNGMKFNPKNIFPSR